MAASSTDAAEIQAGQLAQAKARSPRVKAFAAKMVSDHTATSQKLMGLAQTKGVTVTPMMTDEQQQMASKLQADAQRMFDRDYVHGQIAGHTQAVKAFQTEIADGQDADLKAFAQATLPTIQQHLAMAKRLGR